MKLEHQIISEARKLKSKITSDRKSVNQNVPSQKDNLQTSSFFIRMIGLGKRLADAGIA